VPGSALLVGGDPGVGKSTLILQALAAYARRRHSAVYISGEEAMAQVRLRAARMGLADAPVALGSATCVEDILATLEGTKPPGIVAIDSIQTIWTSALEAAPGTIAQVRTASFDLVRYAKASPARRFCSSAMSPRTARSPDPRRSSIWSMRCSISKASAAIISACCAR
jgi:DNA repair protein RadA/Sms